VKHDTSNDSGACRKRETTIADSFLVMCGGDSLPKPVEKRLTLADTRTRNAFVEKWRPPLYLKFGQWHSG
jgi:hypothetical protein